MAFNSYVAYSISTLAAPKDRTVSFSRKEVNLTRQFPVYFLANGAFLAKFGGFELKTPALRVLTLDIYTTASQHHGSDTPRYDGSSTRRCHG